MAVQIPELQRDAAPQPASVGRLDVRLPNPEREMAQSTQATEIAGGAIADYAQSVQNQQDQAVAYKKDFDFETWHQKQLDGDPQTGEIGIRFQKGDPAVLYKKLEDDTAKKIKDLTGDESLSPRNQIMVGKRLANRAAQLQMKTLTIYGEQQARYDDGVTNAIGQLRQKNLVDATTLIHPDDKGGLDQSTFAPFEKAISDIRDPIIQQGMRYGNVTPYHDGDVVPDGSRRSYYVDDDGKPVPVVIGASTDLQIKKSLSKGIFNAIDNLAKEGSENSLNVAKAIKDKYGDYLDPVLAERADGYIGGGEFTNKAYKLAQDYQRTQNINTINKIKDPELRDKVLGIATEQKSKMDMLQNRQSRDNYNLIANHVNQVMNSAQPFPGINAMMEDPVVKNALGNVTDAKQRQAILDLVQQPKTSSASAQSKMMNLIVGADPAHPDGLKGMPNEDLIQAKSGLNKVDQATLQRKWEGANSETGSQMQIRYKQANQTLNRDLIANGYLRSDDGVHVRPNDQAKQTAAYQEMIARLDARGSQPMTPKEIDDYANAMATHLKQGEAFAPPAQTNSWKATGPAFGNGGASQKSFRATGPAFNSVTGGAQAPGKSIPTTFEERQPWAKKYYDSHKSTWANPQQLDEYIKANQ